jgi:hypothetical protein
VESQTSILQIYPNPSNNKLYITGEQIDGHTYIIYDLKGRKMSSNNYHSTTGINVQDLKIGMYIMAIQIDHQWKTLKFIKK